MSTHTPTGSLLAIHSVVVLEEYRRKGVATAMLQNYLELIQDYNDKMTTAGGNGDDEYVPIQSVVLLAKSHLLSFYVDCGFRVNRPSPIVHGQEQWYELEKIMAIPSSVDGDTSSVTADTITKNIPANAEGWYCKTETFKKTFPFVKPHLEAHKSWVHDLRRQGVCITSGYRVDADGKPGGGGLMFLAAGSYVEALEVVLQDPLVANDCVDWELNGWIGQVGDVQMR
eukprot:CAMPEP_0197234808 /NCGR_PEP_ID=MMETSP1429-20130617/2457_1 /TAXON_ID=49237 /ORGANISM="Chaetoceros  sp., Strain UNC1202" /LENGTH=226 /DNA_ID=CAMNT_0042693299 /DNA_START=15 /DNA_END=695 /DNA_ORIENTATION=-